MTGYGHDADSITRWAIRKSYRIRNPTPEQVARYRFWHHVSRTDGFDASGPWECWVSREILPDAVVPATSPEPAPPPVVPAARGGDSTRHDPPHQRERRSARAAKVRRELRTAAALARPLPLTDRPLV